MLGQNLTSSFERIKLFRLELYKRTRAISTLKENDEDAICIVCVVPNLHEKAV